MSYIAKATVWLKIDTKYADGVGEAQHEVRQFIQSLEKFKGVLVAHATKVEIPVGDLQVIHSESDRGLIVKWPCGKQKVLDDGLR